MTCIRSYGKQERQCAYNVTSMHVEGITTVVEMQQVLHISVWGGGGGGWWVGGFKGAGVCLRACSLTYAA
jgi:hypothetical protein